jgi:pilus assembly protein CpaF
VQVERLQGGPRRVSAVTEVVGVEDDALRTQDHFAFHQTGVDADGRAHGQFVATGARPACAARLRAAGLELPANLFVQRVLLRA